MIQTIVLDSGPLGLLMMPKGHREGDACRAWAATRLGQGVRMVVTEIIDYELRRELIRAGFTAAISDLDAFNGARVDRFLPLNSGHLQTAAQLWAQARNQGVPTAHRHALDIDVILAAQALSLGIALPNFIVATGNVRHLSRFVPAELWQKI
jgi:predicted nucleic acid-binding protein